MNANTELPQPSPKCWNIFGPAKGRIAPNNERITALAAVTDAAYSVKASIKYVVIGIWDMLDKNSGSDCT